mgnify:CR=1 FL=1
MQATNISEIFKEYILFRRIQLVEIVRVSQSIVEVTESVFIITSSEFGD